MILFLARHEWKVLTASAVVRLVVAVFATAVVAATLLGMSRAARDREIHDLFAMRAGQPRSPRAEAVANETGRLVLVPPAPLAALAIGQSDVHPSYLKVTARTLDALVTGDQIEHPLAVATGQLDLAFIVLFLYPLLICAVSFDLTAGDRDRGTLRMVLSQPVRLRDLVAGKLLARIVLLAVPIAVIPAAFGVTQTAGLHLLVWTAAVLAYGMIWHGLALLVNARGWSAPANALALAGIWLMLAVVGPATINLLITIRYPVPSRVEAAVQARAATRDATVQGSRELGQFLQDHPTSANVGRDGLRQFARLQAARDRQVADRLERVEAAFDAQLERQRRLAGWLSVLSPTMVAQGVLLEAAGTSTARFEHFRAQAAAFQREWQRYFEPRVLDAATLTAAEIAGAPAFTYRELPASVMASRVAAPLLAMLLAGALLNVAGLSAHERRRETILVGK